MFLWRNKKNYLPDTLSYIELWVYFLPIIYQVEPNLVLTLVQLNADMPCFWSGSTLFDIKYIMWICSNNLDQVIWLANN